MNQQNFPLDRDFRSRLTTRGT